MKRPALVPALAALMAAAMPVATRADPATEIVHTVTEGETLTGGTSGATATVRRVTLTAGTWDGSAAGFLTIDILVVWGAFMLWVIPDARRIGLGTKTGLTFLLLSFLGTCFAFPLYLIVRERHLAANTRAE